MNNKIERLGNKMDGFKSQVSNNFEFVNGKFHGTETENNWFLEDQQNAEEVKVNAEQPKINATG